MKSVKLDTAEFDFLEPGILRVRVYSGVEVDEAIAKEYSETIAKLTSKPTGLLVDKQNQYSLTFNAQKLFLSHLPNIAATAILVHRSVTGLSAQTQLPFLRTDKHHVEIFHSQQEAVQWLKDELTIS